MGCLYIIAHRNALKMYKIGITKNWKQRSKSLRVGKDTYCHLLINFPEDIEKSIEREMHAKFSAFRLPQSEWFNLDINNFFLVRSSVMDSVTENDGKVLYDIEEKSKEEKYVERLAMECLYDWLENDIFDNFLEEKYKRNPFLNFFEVCYEGEEVVTAHITFIQPNNEKCTLRIYGYWCSKRKDTVMYLAEPWQSLEDYEQKGNWYANNYGHEEIELDEYLDILWERLRVLTKIDQNLWPSRVWADIIKTGQYAGNLR